MPHHLPHRLHRSSARRLRPRRSHRQALLAPTLLAVLSAVSTVSTAATAPSDARPADVTGPATLVVDGTTCTLRDAIRAANEGSTVGGCTGTAGADIIELDADATFMDADPTSSLTGGAQAALPDVSSEITLRAGVGSTIERDPSLPCRPSETEAPFRLINIVDDGDLHLIDITLRYGCVAPPPGVIAKGGGIHVGGLLQVTGATIEDNTAVSNGFFAEGGGIYCFGGGISRITDTTIRRNLARSLELDGAVQSARGGGAYFQCFVETIEDSTVTSNVVGGAATAELPDQGGYAEGGGLYFFDSFLTELVRSEISNNRAVGGLSAEGLGTRGTGGGIAFTWSGGGVIGESQITGNVASVIGQTGGDAFGGAISITGLEPPGPGPTIRSSQLDNNLALGGAGSLTIDAGAAYGGAIHAVRNLHHIVGSMFSDNEAWAGAPASAADVTLARGGAIDTTASVGPIARSTFLSNVARTAPGLPGFAEGGAIRSEGPLEIVSSVFDSNRADGGDAADPSAARGNGYGGAVATRGTLLARASTFSRNVAVGGNVAGEGGRGGALWIGAPLDESGAFTGLATVEIVGSLFDDNLIDLSPPTPEDCRDFNGLLSSLGYNLVEAPGSCSFAATGDLVGVRTSTYDATSRGCDTPLPSGGCPWTVAIDQASPAADAGSCVAAAVAVDHRDVARPFDLPTVADTDDACDIGAYEAIDGDGDGVTDAGDCAPGDPTRAITDPCGVCGGDSSTCLLFGDDFESGGVSQWSSST